MLKGRQACTVQYCTYRKVRGTVQYTVIGICMPCNPQDCVFHLRNAGLIGYRGEGNGMSTGSG